MTHHNFGTIIDSGIMHEDGHGNEGLVALNGSVSLTDIRTLPAKITGPISAGPGPSVNGLEILALQLEGEVLGSDGDRLSVVFSIPWLDAGKLAAMLFHAAKRGQDEHTDSDFGLGFYEEDQRYNDQREDRTGNGQ